MTAALEELAAAKYALLTTYRKDGRSVPTPVWIVKLGGGLAVWTVADSGKVKRIRRDSSVTVATCDVRGNNAGTTYPARAELLDAAGTEQVRRELVGKYGLAGRVTLLASRFRRGRSGTVGIRVTLAPPG